MSEVHYRAFTRNHSVCTHGTTWFKKKRSNLTRDKEEVTCEKCKEVMTEVNRFLNRCFKGAIVES